MGLPIRGGPAQDADMEVITGSDDDDDIGGTTFKAYGLPTGK